MKRKHDNEELEGLENLIYTPLPLELDKRSFEWCGSKRTALIHSFTCLEYPLVALRARNISIPDVVQIMIREDLTWVQVQ